MPKRTLRRESAALEHRHFPRTRRNVVPQDVRVAARADFEVAMIGSEPLIDNLVDVEQLFAQAKPDGPLLAPVACVTVDGDGSHQQREAIVALRPKPLLQDCDLSRMIDIVLDDAVEQDVVGDAGAERALARVVGGLVQL